MTSERPVVRKAAQLVALVSELRDDFSQDAGDLPHPVYWPSLSAEDAVEKLEELRRWVAVLAVRFPSLVKLPECWWQHNDLIELLAALRDCERGCYARTAPPTAAADWHQVLRNLEQRLDMWIRRLPCSAPGIGHRLERQSPTPSPFE